MNEQTTNDLAPSLHPHYRSLITTTSQSASAPRDGTQSLTVSPRPGHSLSPRTKQAVSGRAFSRSTRKQPDQTRVASMPDTAWPINGHPPGSSRDHEDVPVLMPSEKISTLHQRFARARLSDPYLNHRMVLFPHRSPRQSSANAAVGGLKPPPAGRLRRAYLHLSRSTTVRSRTYIELPLTFVTHPRVFRTVDYRPISCCGLPVQVLVVNLYRGSVAEP